MNLDRFVFLKIENKEARKKILNLVRVVVPEILRHSSSVVSIMLVGSFARQEGVWKVKREKIKIMSDLDLLVITKKRENISERLRKPLKELEQKVGTTVDLTSIRYSDLEKLPKNTHTLDRKRGLTIWGKNVTSKFPKFEKDDIDFKDILFLFFNRVLLTLENLIFIDFKCTNEDFLERLSYEATKTMFTCTDLINIYCNDYQTSFTEKVKNVNKQLRTTNVEIDKKMFLKDLNKASNFVFKETSLLYFPRSYEYWLTARNYLIKLFFSFLEKEKNQKTIVACIDALKLTKKLTLKSWLILSYKLLRSKRIPRIFWKMHPSIYCRIASLLLYLAIGKRNSLTEKYVIDSEAELSKVYFFKKSDGKAWNRWIRTRDDLVRLHKIGMF